MGQKLGLPVERVPRLPVEHKPWLPMERELGIAVEARQLAGWGGVGSLVGAQPRTDSGGCRLWLRRAPLARATVDAAIRRQHGDAVRVLREGLPCAGMPLRDDCCKRCHVAVAQQRPGWEGASARLLGRGQPKPQCSASMRLPVATVAGGRQGRHPSPRRARQLFQCFGGAAQGFPDMLSRRQRLEGRRSRRELPGGRLGGRQKSGPLARTPCGWCPLSQGPVQGPLARALGRPRAALLGQGCGGQEGWAAQGPAHLRNAREP
mmetsp:Transcript_107063/g.298171  ORF Transcript_107063/g.298171 Transcript_107063/m.298171 type:complete len:263 (-) Transcript_107063:206-994(-)